MIKVFYSAYTCQGNIGDLLITKYQIEEYAKYGEVYVDCHGMPNDFQTTIFKTDNHNIKNFEHEYGIYYRSKNILKVLRTINKDGFTHFCSSPGPRDVLSLPIKKLCFKLLGNIIPRVMLNSKIKRYSLGVDLNYKNSGILGMLNKWYFKDFDVIGVRSVVNQRSMTPILGSVRYTPDMAFLYPKFVDKISTTYIKRVCISFRKVDNYDLLLTKLRDIAQSFGKLGVDVDIVYQVAQDYVFCEQLYNDLQLTNVHFTKTMIDFDGLGCYSQYDMVISNRLHVLLMAAMNGAVPYGVISHDSKENKIADLFSTVFCHNLYSFLESFNSSIILPIYTEMDVVKKQLITDVGKQRKLCQKTFSDLLS